MAALIFLSVILITALVLVVLTVVQVYLETDYRFDEIYMEASNFANPLSMRKVIKRIFEDSILTRELSYLTQLKIVSLVIKFVPQYLQQSSSSKEIVNMVLTYHKDIAKMHDLDKPYRLLKLEDGTLLEDYMQENELLIAKSRLNRENTATTGLKTIKVETVDPQSFSTEDLRKVCDLDKYMNGTFGKDIYVLVDPEDY